jgi:hypothetical protein
MSKPAITFSFAKSWGVSVVEAAVRTGDSVDFPADTNGMRSPRRTVRPAYDWDSVSMPSPGNISSFQAPPFGVDRFTKNLFLGVDCPRACRGSREERKGMASMDPPTPFKKCLRPDVKISLLSDMVITSVEAALLERRRVGELDQ